MKPRQKTLAALLAAGASAREAADALGVSVSYVNVLLKGELFNYEIDAQRRELIGERLEEYTKLVSEQLVPNLQRLIAIRDDEEAPPAARIRAIELINDSIVPKAKVKAPTKAEVRVVLAPEQKVAIETAVAETKQSE
jgi:hypothetical protein